MEIKMNNDGKMEVDFSGVPDYVMDAFNNLMKKIGEWNQSQQELKSSENQRKDNKRWKPNDDVMYYYLSNNGTIREDTWVGLKIDDRRYNFNNVFKIKEEAEFELERRKVIIELEDYAREHNDEIKKYFIVYDKDDNDLCVDYNCVSSLITLGVIYFSSEKIAENAIKYVGEDRIKKYCFGVDADIDTNKNE